MIDIPENLIERYSKQDNYISDQLKLHNNTPRAICHAISKTVNADSSWRHFYEPEMSVHELNEWYQNNPY